MKKIYFIISFVLASIVLNAQTGIGTTTPLNKFEVVTSTADPASSGSAANGNIRIGPSLGSHVLDFGLGSSSTFAWMQVRSKLAYGTTYNLALNPIGGNVGIGTTNPTAKLNIVGGGIKIFNGFANNSTTRPVPNSSTIGNYEIRGVGGAGGVSQADFGDDGFLRLSAGGGTNSNTQAFIDISGFSGVSDMNSNIAMFTTGTERLRIDNTGNVGIGTSAPTTKLQVNGDIIANSIAGSSDIRFKTNIRPIEKALDKVKSLKGVYFNWNQKDFPAKDFSDKTELGFIAQEVEKVLPEIVTKDNSSDAYRSVKYDKVVALLVEAIKEQQKQIDCLNIKLNNLNKTRNKR